jgi:hypothetical protein
MTMLTSRAGRRRLALTIAVSAILLPALAACDIIPTACSAVGWINTADLVVADAPDGAVVIACAGKDCKPAVVEAGATPDASTIAATATDSGKWRLDVGMSQPKYINVTVLDVTGAALVTQEFKNDWKRVGGSEQCGGPAKTSDLALAV